MDRVAAEDVAGQPVGLPTVRVGAATLRALAAAARTLHRLHEVSVASGRDGLGPKQATALLVAIRAADEALGAERPSPPAEGASE